MKINIRGIDLAYDESGHGPAILFLHGYPFNRSMWREQIEFLTARGYRCVAPDLRGLGESVVQTGCGDAEPEHRLQSLPPTTMAEVARDAAALIDELTVDRAVVCGLSMGSYVALEFMRLFGERVAALVLAGARAQAADEFEKQSRELQARRVLAEGLDYAVESISTNLLAQNTLINKADVVARVREMIFGTNPQGAAAAQRGMALRRDYAATLHDIRIPTLIIAGREDGVRKPEDAEFLHRGIANSRLEIIADAGHLMNMEQAEIFNQALAEFLKSVSH
jgi:pimeloyl-ACP methyl ester carboxylesterase